MKKALVAAAAAALAAGAVTATGASKPKDDTARCVVSSGTPHTIVANEDVRVYGVERPYANNTFRTAVYACSFRTGKKVAVGTAAVADDENEENTPVRYIRSIRLTPDLNDGNGASLAFVDTNCLKRPCRHEIVVKSLKTGKTVRRMKAGGPFDQLAISHPTDQDGVALAWLETSNVGGTCEGQGCRVHLVKDSGDKVLDEGTDIESDFFGSLDNFSPGIITSGGTNEFVWKRGGTIKSASFND